MDTAFFSERDHVCVRYALADVGIYICAPEVLLLFSDNFDFQHMQRDFLRGVLSEEELGNKLYVHELRGAYAAQVCPPPCGNVGIQLRSACAIHGQR